MREGNVHNGSAVLRPLVALGWFLAVLLLYYPAWRPDLIVSNAGGLVPLDLASSFLRLGSGGMDELALLAVGMLAAYGMGSLILGAFRVSLGGLTGALFPLALGTGGLSLSTFLTGVTLGFGRAGYGFLAVVMAAFAVYGAYRAYGSSGSAPPDGRTVRRTALYGLFVTALCLVTVFLFSEALRPPVFYDAITYHLGVPNYWLQEGRIGYIPYDSYSNFPFMAEMLYTLGMLMYGLKLGQFASVAVFVMCVLAAYDLARTQLPEMDPALAGLFVLATPAFMENVVQYSCDLYLMLFTLMAVYSYLMYERTRNTGFIALMGVFTGICLGTKLIALVSVLLPASAAAAYAAYTSRKEQSARPLAVLAAFALPAVLVYSPWFIKNLVYTGNPFYPAFYGVFGGKDMSAACYAVHSMYHPSLTEGAEGLYNNLYGLFFETPSYVSAHYRAASYLGLLLPFVVPLGLLGGRVPRQVKLLAAFSLVLYVMWSFAFPLTRYLYPAVVAMSVAGAYFLHRISSGAPAWGRWLSIAAVTVCLLVNFSLGFYLVDSWSNRSGLEHVDETDREYLLRRMGDGGTVVLASYPVYGYINENLPADARVLIVGDAQHLYINRRHVYTYLSAADPYEAFLKHPGDAQSVARELRGDGITHIVYNPAEMNRLQKTGYISYPMDMDGLITEFLKSPHVRPVGSGGPAGYQAYLFELTG